MAGIDPVFESKRAHPGNDPLIAALPLPDEKDSEQIATLLNLENLSDDKLTSQMEDACQTWHPDEITALATQHPCLLFMTLSGDDVFGQSPLQLMSSKASTADFTALLKALEEKGPQGLALKVLQQSRDIDGLHIMEYVGVSAGLPYMLAAWMGDHSDLSADQHFALGQKALAADHPKLASYHYRAIPEDAPEYAEAQYRIGRIFLYSAPHAVVPYILAANKGHAAAKRMLEAQLPSYRLANTPGLYYEFGLMYRHGINGVLPKDEEQAAHYFQLAKDGGYIVPPEEIRTSAESIKSRSPGEIEASLKALAKLSPEELGNLMSAAFQESRPNMSEVFAALTPTIMSGAMPLATQVMSTLSPEGSAALGSLMTGDAIDGAMKMVATAPTDLCQASIDVLATHPDQVAAIVEGIPPATKQKLQDLSSASPDVLSPAAAEDLTQRLASIPRESAERLDRAFTISPSASSGTPSNRGQAPIIPPQKATSKPSNLWFILLLLGLGGVAYVITELVLSEFVVSKLLLTAAFGLTTSPSWISFGLLGLIGLLALGAVALASYQLLFPGQERLDNSKPRNKLPLDTHSNTTPTRSSSFSTSATPPAPVRRRKKGAGTRAPHLLTPAGATQPSRL